jgi:hypothetical protein
MSPARHAAAMKNNAEAMKRGQPATMHFMPFSDLTAARVIENMRLRQQMKA